MARGWRAGWLLLCSALIVPASGEAAGALVRDPVTGCATSNPYPEGPEGSESIRWNGACQDGLLSGYGTLVWYRGNAETERNEGMFWAGEMHGPASTAYPDGTRILGTYNTGQRNGQFMTFRPDGSHVVSEFQDGRLIAEHAVAAPQSALQQAPPMMAQPAMALQTAVRAFEPDPVFQTIIISGNGVTTGPGTALPRPVQIAHAGQADSPRYAAPNQPVPTNTYPAVRALTPSHTPAVLPRSPVAGQAYIQTPEARFVAALTAEGAGRTNEAASAYSDLMAQYPHSDSARLAAGRLAMLPAMAPSAAAVAAPAATGSPATAGKFVCTMPGLFDRNSKWCGVVRQANAAYVSVEIKRVNANGIFNIGFNRTPCTGNTFITRLSRGSRVTVPQNCMGPSW